MSSMTVVIPNYNDATLLPRSVGALEEARDVIDEVLIVDDASTDDSLEVIARLREQTGLPITVHARETNQGVLAGIRDGLRHARSPLVYFGAANDRVLPGFFRRASAAAARHPAAGMFFTGMHIVGVDGALHGVARPQVLNGETWLPPERYIDDLLRTEAPGYSHSASTVYRREVLLEIEVFPEALSAWADTWTGIEVALRWGAVYLDGPGAEWTLDDDGYSGRFRTSVALQEATIREADERMRTPPFDTLLPDDVRRRLVTGWRMRVMGDDALLEDLYVRADIASLRAAYLAAAQGAGRTERLTRELMIAGQRLRRFLGR